MPDAPKQPVTVGDLRLPCEHGYYENHWVHTWPFHQPPMSFGQNRECDSRPATVADLVSACGGPGGMLDLLIKGGFLKVVVRTVGMEHHVYYEVEALPI